MTVAAKAITARYCPPLPPFHSTHTPVNRAPSAASAARHRQPTTADRTGFRVSEVYQPVAREPRRQRNIEQPGLPTGLDRRNTRDFGIRLSCAPPFEVPRLFSDKRRAIGKEGHCEWLVEFRKLDRDERLGRTPWLAASLAGPAEQAASALPRISACIKVDRIQCPSSAVNPTVP